LHENKQQKHAKQKIIKAIHSSFSDFDVAFFRMPPAAINKAIAIHKGNKVQKAESKFSGVRIVGNQQIGQVDSLLDPNNQKDQLNKQKCPLSSHVLPKATIVFG
jgi:hypothetical protein